MKYLIPMNMKKFIGFLFLIFFCFRLGAVFEGVLPLAVSQATEALFRVESIFSGSEFSGGTGFAVRSKDGRKFVVTNRHIVQEDKGFSNPSASESLEIEFAQDIKLTHWKTKKQFIVKRSVRVSIYADLALMEVPDYTGPVIPIARFNVKRDRQKNYMIGFEGKHLLYYQMQSWYTFFSSEIFLMGMTYSPLRRGGSGSPLLNGKGQLIGVLYGSGGVFEPEKFFITSDWVQKLLNSVRDHKDSSLFNQFDEEMASIKASAEGGDSEAQFLLSHLYSKEHFNQPEESLKWKQEAAKNGDLMALFFTAENSLDEENYEKAIPLLEKAADKGSARAAYLLGKMYVTGFPVSQDMEKGLYRLRQAVEGGYPLALLMLGGILAGHNEHIVLGKTSGWRSFLSHFFPISNKSISEGQRLLHSLAERRFSRNLHNVRRMLNVLKDKGYSHDVPGGMKLLFYLTGDLSEDGDLFQSLLFLYNLGQQGFVPTVSAGLQFLDVLEKQGLSQKKREQTMEEYMFFSLTDMIAVKRCEPDLFSSE